MILYSKDFLSTYQTMIKLLISGFLLSISFMTDAAIVEPTELTDNPVQPLGQQKNKTSPPTPSQHATSPDITNAQATELPNKQIQLLNQKKNHPPSFSQQEIQTSRNVKDILFLNTLTSTLMQQENPHRPSPNKLNSFTKMLINEYGDNELVQDSLSILYEIEQLWDDTDSLVNEFVYNILFALQLDDFIEKDLANTQQSIQASSVYILSRKDLNVSNQIHKINNISFHQIQNARTNTSSTSSQNSQGYKSTFLSGLFEITTLYYLIGLFICYSILHSAISLISRRSP